MRNQSRKITEVIQDFLLNLYKTGKDFTFLKHLGFSLLPITSSFILSVPDMFAQTEKESMLINMTVGTTFPSKNHHLKNGKEPCELLLNIVGLYPTVGA